jgi:hypothetical protein
MKKAFFLIVLIFFGCNKNEPCTADTVNKSKNHSYIEKDSTTGFGGKNTVFLTLNSTQYENVKGDNCPLGYSLIGQLLEIENLTDSFIYVNGYRGAADKSAKMNIISIISMPPKYKIKQGITGMFLNNNPDTIFSLIEIRYK